MKFILGLLTLLWADFATAAYVNAAQACNAPEKATYSKSVAEELEYFCRLPERVQRNLPEGYWYSPLQYRAWLKALPTRPAARANFGKSIKEGDEIVNRLVLEREACHFYSSISPSVQAGKVDLADPRTFVVLDAPDLLAKCEQLDTYLGQQKLPRCSVVEFAGHSIQAASLDTVFGVEGGLHAYPSSRWLGQLGACLRRISEPRAYAVFSTCGGDTELLADGSYGRAHYWPGKARAQKKLSHLFQMPILSGVGSVSGTTDGGVSSPEGWHLTR